jgi:hypothetical protein
MKNSIARQFAGFLFTVPWEALNKLNKSSPPRTTYCNQDHRSDHARVLNMVRGVPLAKKFSEQLFFVWLHHLHLKMLSFAQSSYRKQYHFYDNVCVCVCVCQGQIYKTWTFVVFRNYSPPKLDFFRNYGTVHQSLSSHCSEKLLAKLFLIVTTVPSETIKSGVFCTSKLL